MSISLDVLTLGVVQGLTYAILAVGLVLIYKSGRFINFAHGNIGALAAVLLGKLVIDVGLPYWVAFVAVLAGAALLGATIELTVVRRLFEAPRLVLMVATIGVSQLLLVITILPATQAEQSRLVMDGYPTPFNATWTVGNLLLGPADIAILFMVPIVAIALAAFFKLTSFGLGIRASSENADAARLAGISARRMSTLTWVIAAVLAALTAVLLAPKGSVFEIGALGPSMLVRALGAGLIARMTNLPVTFVAGLGIGVFEAVVFANFTEGGTTDLLIFLIVMAALLWRARDLSRSSRDADEGLNYGVAVKELTAKAAALPQVKLLRQGTVVMSVAVAAVLPLLPVFGLNRQATAFMLALTCAFIIVGLSLCLLTGWAGQVSLGQFALAGVGAFAAARLAGQGLPLPVVVVGAGLVGAIAAAVVGLPALRVQGLYLAVSTLAFAVVGSAWLFQQEFFVVTPAGVLLERPPILGSERAVYYFGLIVVVLCTWLVANFRRSSPGRTVMAARDNDKHAAALGVPVTRARLMAFMLSGFLAAVGGVVWAYASQRYTSSAFNPAIGLTVLSMVIVGGLGSIPGAILGAIFVVGIPAIFADSQVVSLLVSGIGLLIFLLFIPGGLIRIVHTARDTLIDRIVRRHEGLPPPPRLVPPLKELWDTALGRNEPGQRHDDEDAAPPASESERPSVTVGSGHQHD